MANAAFRQILTDFASFDLACLSLLASADAEIDIFTHDWQYPLFESRPFHDALHAFLSRERQNRVRIVLRQPMHAQRHAERLKALVRKFPDQVLVHQGGVDATKQSDTLFVVDHTHYLRRLDENQPRSVWVGHDPAEVKPLQNRFNDAWDESHVVISATVLGL